MHDYLQLGNMAIMHAFIDNKSEEAIGIATSYRTPSRNLLAKPEALG